MYHLRLLIGLCWLATSVSATELILFEHDNFNGRRFPIQGLVQNLANEGFNDKTSSVVVSGGVWQLCDDAYFRGKCITLRAGEYPSLRALDMNDRISSVRELSGWGAPPAASSEREGGQGGHWGEGVRLVLYEHRHFAGRSLAVSQHALRNLVEAGFNDRASSLRVEQGYWMLCSDADFQGECATFGPGEYPQLPAELNNRVSSARRIAQRYPYNHNPSWGWGHSHSQGR